MEQKKKLTSSQLRRRLQNALLHVDKTKDTISIYFDDKGLRLTANEDKALIATNYHTHVFDAYTVSGGSRPYLYTKRIIEIAQENDCISGNGYSYNALKETLKAKEDQSEYNIVVYYEWWLMNIFNSLYAIGETEAETFIVYLDYIYAIAKNSVLLSEKTEDVTNRQFVEKVIDNIKAFTDNLEERVLLPKKTDEQVAQENMEAMQQDLEERIIEDSIEEKENGVE